MRIYISAPITGKDPEELTIFFKAVKARIVRAGHVPISPWDISQELPRGEHADYMAVDMAIIKHFADAVLFAGDYQHSKGCQEELEFCLGNNIKIFTSINGISGESLGDGGLSNG